MNNENNNNMKPDAIIRNLLSEKVNNAIKRYDVTADHSADSDYYKKVGEARKLLDTLAAHYNLMTPEQYAKKYNCKEAASKYVGFQFVIGYSVMSINKQAPKLVSELCNKAWDVEARVSACHELNGACSNGCADRRPHCEYGYFCRYKKIAVFVYDFDDAEMHKLCGEGMPASMLTKDKWKKLVLDKRQDFFDDQMFGKKDGEYSVKFNNLLCTPTPWLGMTNLFELYKMCGKNWGKFMDVINTTTDAINSEGVWDVELGTSRYSKEGSCLYETTTAENGSVALSPRRTVVVRVPKYHDVVSELDYDRVMLFLELTFYKYAGIKPMLPVIQVRTPEGAIDYAVDYSRDNYFEESAPAQEMDIADLTYLAHYEDTEDEDLEDSDEFEEFEETDEVDTSVDWGFDDDDYGFRTSEATGTDTVVSLLVTDDREAKPFSFKINFINK